MTDHALLKVSARFYHTCKVNYSLLDYFDGYYVDLTYKSHTLVHDEILAVFIRIVYD